MFKKKILFSILLVLCTGLGACNKWLDLKPEDGLVGDEFWTTKEQVQSAVIGCYISMLTVPPDERVMAENLFMYGELRADMVRAGNFATIDEQDIMNVNILSSNPISDWTGLYRIINYCNNVIDYAPAVRQKDPTFSQTELDGYVAEALTIRAFMYFVLARTWGNVPLKLTATKNDKDNFQIPVSSQNDVFLQIEKDLLEAEGKAKTTYGTIAADKGRVTKYTVNAFQADLYLWMEQYQKALDACEKIISSNKFQLVQGDAAWFNTLFANGNSVEGIFELQFDAQQLNPFFGTFSQRQRYIASSRVMQEIYTTDLEDPENVDIRGDKASLIASNNTIYKYIGINATERKTVDQSFTHWFVYRYADILMMKAEASNQLGDGQIALDLVEEVRDRANALDGTKRNPDPDSKVEITNYILEERAREFAFEGKRWFDVLRNAKRNNYERLDLLLDMAAVSAPPNNQQSVINKYKDVNSHYLPVYFQELYTNKALVQNPFYQ